MVARLDSDKRKARRFRVHHLAKIVIDSEQMISCTVEDLSTDGAKIALPSHVSLPERFELFIAAHHLLSHPARIRWREGDFLGVSFCDAATDEQAPVPQPEEQPDIFAVEIERDERRRKCTWLRYGS